MVAAKNAGHSLSKKDNTPIEWVMLSTSDLYHVICRKDGSPPQSFRNTLHNRLRRLKGTQYEFDLEIGGEQQTGNFSFIGDFILPKKTKGRHGKIFVQIPGWVVNMVKNWGVLTYHKDYYALPPFERRLYEVARFFVRQKNMQNMYLATVQEKHGSKMPEKSFRAEIKKLVNNSPEKGVFDLLDYVMKYDEVTDKVDFVLISDYLRKTAEVGRVSQ
jgi:hypothetical protein